MIQISLMETGKENCFGCYVEVIAVLGFQKAGMKPQSLFSIKCWESVFKTERHSLVSHLPANSHPSLPPLPPIFLQLSRSVGQTLGKADINKTQRL